MEINASFYRIPTPTTTRQWVNRVSRFSAFRFTAKLWQGFTHTTQAGSKDAAAFRQAMDPLHESGRLGALLMQFPYRFHHTADNRQYLRHLVTTMRHYPLILEVRHRSRDRPQV